MRKDQIIRWSIPTYYLPLAHRYVTTYLQTRRHKVLAGVGDEFRHQTPPNPKFKCPFGFRPQKCGRSPEIIEEPGKRLQIHCTGIIMQFSGGPTRVPFYELWNGIRKFEMQ